MLLCGSFVFLFCLVFAMSLCAGSGLWCLLWVCHFPIGILGRVWYLIVSIPDLCALAYFNIITYGNLSGVPLNILSSVVARNYVSSCIFCIVWCQQISIWNKQIESSIYLIKQVWFFFNLMTREGAGDTENQDFRLRNRGTQRFI